MTSLTTDVLIIGAGPSGMVAALCLARRGVTSLIVERRAGLQTHPKAHEVSARSIEILHGLGIGYDELAAEASPHADASRVVFCDTIGEEFGRIDLAEGDGARKYREHLAAPTPYLNLSQVELEKILLARVHACPETSLLYDHQWESLAQDERGVECRVTDRTDGETVTVRSAYVLCADGAGSRSRAALGIAMVGPERLREFVNASFRGDLSRVVSTRAKLYFVFSPKCPGSAFIAHHVERRWVFHLPVAVPDERVEDFTPEVLARRIRDALGRDDVDFEITSTSHWSMSAQVAERFRAGRAFLVGDAAHRFPPTGGLGMNTGIGDVHNLAWKLGAVLRGGAPDALLDTYETERRPVIQANCDESRRNYENMSEVVEAFGLSVEQMRRVDESMRHGVASALPAPVLAWCRSLMQRYGASVLARFHHDPAVRARVEAAVARQRSHFDRIGLDLGYVYARGALVPDGAPADGGHHAVSEYTPSTRPGARWPHFVLAGGEGRSSHALVDYARSTLVTGAAVEIVDGLREEAEAVQVGVAALGEGDHAGAQIEPDGALLLRPDGHVAWRQARGVALSGARVRELVREAYGAEG